MPIMTMHADHAECAYTANSLVWRLTPAKAHPKELRVLVVVTLKHTVIMNDIAPPACMYVSEVQGGEADEINYIHYILGVH